MKKYTVAVIAILCITVLIDIALLKGINGAAMASGIAIIAGLGGYIVGAIVKPK